MDDTARLKSFTLFSFTLFSLLIILSSLWFLFSFVLITGGEGATVYLQVFSADFLFINDFPLHQ